MNTRTSQVINEAAAIRLARYLLRGDVGAELHWLMHDFTTASTQSNCGDQRRYNDHVLDLHSLLS